MADVLHVQNLTVSFDTGAGAVRVVEDVSFPVRSGEVLGIVGESGCGKTVTAMSILRLLPSPPGRLERGTITFAGRDLSALPVAELRKIRGQQISMIFQEPMTALSPLHRIGRQLCEAIQLHRKMSRDAAWAMGEEWLGKVGLPGAADCMHKYPHQLSGGMRQRVMIAMALMLQPQIVIADEPTTALDVTIQAQIFDLMLSMKGERTSLILITHDMGAVWEMCDRVLVMYAGRIVEEGPVADIFRQPSHPYTEGLLKAMPRVRGTGARLSSIPGQVPAPASYPAGCRFADRCPYAFARCSTGTPAAYPVGPGHTAACYLREEKSP